MKIIKHTIGNVEYSHWTTTDRKATIEWKAKEDGAVYCIWLPTASSFSTSDIDNKVWQVKLDLSKCNTIRKKST